MANSCPHRICERCIGDRQHGICGGHCSDHGCCRAVESRARQFYAAAKQHPAEMSKTNKARHNGGQQGAHAVSFIVLETMLHVHMTIGCTPNMSDTS